MGKSSIARNSFFNIGYRVFAVLFPLVSQAYIARVLMPEQVGLVAFAQNVVSYFTFLAPLGIAKYGVKQISSFRNDTKSLNTVFSELFTINAISTLIFTGLYYLMITSLRYFSDSRALYMIFGLNILFNVFNVDWFYMGIERFDFIAMRSITIKLISFIALILFVKSPSDYLIYAGTSIFALCGNYVVSFFGLKNKVSYIRSGLNLNIHLKPLIILLASSVASELYIMLDSTMIRIIKGNEELAYYSTSSKIIRISFAVLSALYATFFPRLSSLWKENKDGYKKFLSLENEIGLFLGVPCTLGVLCCSKEIILTIFSKKYTDSIITLKILSPLLLIFSLAYILGHIPLLIYGKEKKILMATTAAAIVNISLNAILIPLFGRNGAAIASVVAEITVTVVLIINSSKTYIVKISKESIIKTILSTVIMVAVISVISIVKGPNVIILLMKLLLGSMSYFVTAIIIRHPITSEMKNTSIYRKITKPFRNIG